MDTGYQSSESGTFHSGILLKCCGQERIVEIVHVIKSYKDVVCVSGCL